MAGDWIKMRHNLETDPSVVRIADRLGIDRFAVVGRLKTIWSWADQHSVDGHAVSVTTAFLDSLVECENFCAAMRSCGWLSGRDWELEFPNFDRHNGDSAKKRVLAASRKEKERNVTLSSRQMSRSQRDKSVTREEKRREEVSSNEETSTPLPPKGSSIAEEIYQNYPRKVGKGNAIKAILAALKTTTPDVLQAAVQDYAAAVAKWPPDDQRFIPHPSTWFNQERWKDDRAEWKRGSNQGRDRPGEGLHPDSETDDF